MSTARQRRLDALRSDLDDAKSAEIQWTGEIGSEEHLAVTGEVLRARDALRAAGGAL